MSAQPPPSSTAPVRRRRPQSAAVVVLSLAFAALLVLWVVGGYVLYTEAPADFGRPPQVTVAPSSS